MKREGVMMLIAGAVVGIVAVVLVWLGNPLNMGFCVACFERDVTGALGLHRAVPVQYLRPEILGMVLGAFLAAVFSKEFRSHGGSSPGTRFLVGMFVMIGALVFLGCPLRMILRLAGGDLNAVVGVLGFAGGILLGLCRNLQHWMGRTDTPSYGGRCTPRGLGSARTPLLGPTMTPPRSW